MSYAAKYFLEQQIFFDTNLLRWNDLSRIRFVPKL